MITRAQRHGPRAAAGAPAATTTDLRDQAWYQFYSELEEMRCTGEYDWADKTIAGIMDTVESRKAVTAGQRQAIENIRRSMREREERRAERSSRRYEGFGGRPR